jgi:hypothetical protein
VKKDRGKYSTEEEMMLVNMKGNLMTDATSQKTIQTLTFEQLQE